MNGKREDGFYWIKVGGRWEPAEWDEDAWVVIGGGRLYTDREVEAIKEERMEPPVTAIELQDAAASRP